MADAQLENLGRELPYGREAEVAVIGSVLADGGSMVEAAGIVMPEDFYFVNNREIYSAAMELFNNNEPIDYVTVSDLLKRRGRYELAGGSEYLRSIALEASTSENVSYYARIIREKALFRQLIEKTAQITNMAYEASDRPENVLGMAENAIYEVSAGRESSDIQSVGGILVNTYQQIIDHYKMKGELPGLSTGFDELNRRTGGFHGGELIIIAGRPGMGKSSFAVNIAENVSIRDNKCVAIFNLEMPRDQIVSRILCSQAYIDSMKMQTGDLSSEEWLKLGEIVQRVSNAPLYIDDTPTINVSQIRAKCRRLKQSKGLALVVIDYLQLMQSPERHESRQTEISAISRSLKILAKELDVPVIALSQLSRANTKRNDKRPMLSDLRESGAIEQDADMVIFLHRDGYYNDENEKKQEKASDGSDVVSCDIAKQRQGKTGSFELGWKGEYTKFLNIEHAVKEQ